MDIVDMLIEQAAEIAREWHNGWGNTMTLAADRIAELEDANNTLAEGLKVSQESADKLAADNKRLLEWHDFVRSHFRGAAFWADNHSPAIWKKMEGE